VNDNIRLFTGLQIPEQVRTALLDKLQVWKSDIPFEKWPHIEDWHITLQFLGNVASSHLPAIHEAMKEASFETRSFTLTLNRLGIFGNPRQPSILWIGLADLSPQLLSLHAALGSALQRSYGYQPEERPFHPHITIARKYAGKGPLHPASLPVLDPGNDAFTWTADQVVLFQSHLGRSPMYEPLITAAFTQDPDSIQM
jgi:RNA 2',3'-cyclic 3'-phosphodiesterase